MLQILIRNVLQKLIISLFSFVEIDSDFLIFVKDFFLIAVFVNQNFSSFSHFTKVSPVCPHVSSKIKLNVAHHVTIFFNIN